MANKKARVIAYYLPQFHPTPENDKFWGKGFTEWTNVGRARPLFHGHYQPRIPADLGYYDLRMPEIREQQAELAREAGIEGFCYWHYWFGGGKELLERPFNEVVESGKPDFPFCLGWANHTWSTRTWTSSKTGYKETIIVEMTYPGDEDHISHFYKYLNAFKDKRYIKVDGKLLFVVFAPRDFVDFPHFKDLDVIAGQLAADLQIGEVQHRIIAADHIDGGRCLVHRRYQKKRIKRHQYGTHHSRGCNERPVGQQAHEQFQQINGVFSLFRLCR